LADQLREGVEVTDEGFATFISQADFGSGFSIFKRLLDIDVPRLV